MACWFSPPVGDVSPCIGEFLTPPLNPFPARSRPLTTKIVHQVKYLEINLFCSSMEIDLLSPHTLSSHSSLLHVKLFS